MLLPIHADHPEPRKIRRAVDALEQGGVMDRSHPLAFVCPDLSDIAKYAIVENQIYRVLRHFLPGPYTFILQATREVPKLIQNKRKQIGIRVPASATIQALVRELGRPIISSTAAPPGEEPMVDPHEIDARFKGLAMVLDGGAGGLVPTTVIDLTQHPPEIVREGAGSVEEFR